VSHTVIGTGATLGIHGIVGNEIKVGNDFPLAFDDLAGNPMDASNLRVPTLADVMDLELKNQPKIISISAYGRAALGMGGHGAARPIRLRATETRSSNCSGTPGSPTRMTRITGSRRRSVTPDATGSASTNGCWIITGST